MHRIFIRSKNFKFLRVIILHLPEIRKTSSIFFQHFPVPFVLVRINLSIPHHLRRIACVLLFRVGSYLAQSVLINSFTLFQKSHLLAELLILVQLSLVLCFFQHDVILVSSCLFQQPNLLTLGTHGGLHLPLLLGLLVGIELPAVPFFCLGFPFVLLFQPVIRIETFGNARDKRIKGMSTVGTAQPCDASISADRPQFFLAEHLALPCLVIRPRTWMPGHFKLVCAEFLCVVLTDLCRDLVHACKDGSACCYVCPVSMAGSVIHHPKPAVRHLGDDFADGRVVICGTRHNVLDGRIHIFLVVLSKWCEYTPAAHHDRKSAALGQVHHGILCLFPYGFCQLYEPLVILRCDKLVRDLLIDFLITDVFPFRYLVIHFKHFRPGRIQ